MDWLEHLPLELGRLSLEELSKEPTGSLAGGSAEAALQAIREALQACQAVQPTEPEDPLTFDELEELRSELERLAEEAPAPDDAG